MIHFQHSPEATSWMPAQIQATATESLLPGNGATRLRTGSSANGNGRKVPRVHGEATQPTLLELNQLRRGWNRLRHLSKQKNGLPFRRPLAFSQIDFTPAAAWAVSAFSFPTTVFHTILTVGKTPQSSRGGG
jgi:hypothetical protein